MSINLTSQTNYKYVSDTSNYKFTVIGETTDQESVFILVEKEILTRISKKELDRGIKEKRVTKV